MIFDQLSAERIALCEQGQAAALAADGSEAVCCARAVPNAARMNPASSTRTGVKDWRFTIFSKPIRQAAVIL